MISAQASECERLEEAIALSRSGRHDSALAGFESVLRDNPASEAGWVELGKAHARAGRTERAVECLFKGLELNPRNADAWYELGGVYRSSGRREALVTLLSLRLERDPANPALLRELGRVYHELSRWDDAISAFRSCAAAESGNPETLTLLGRALRECGSREEAAHALEEAARLAPEREAVHLELGRLRREQRDYPSAIDSFETACRLNPDDAGIRLELADLYARARRWESARETTLSVLNSSADDAFVRDRALNEMEILEGKTVLRSHPKRMWVVVTTVCNISCRMCGSWRSQWHLPRKTAEEVMALYPYLERIVWLGGEVFLYRDFQELFERGLRHPNLVQQLTTNAVILSPAWIERIMRARNTDLTISIDGTSKETYEHIRRGARFEKLLERISDIREARAKYGWAGKLRMNAVIMRSNHRELDEFVDFAKEHGFDQLSLMAVHYDTEPGENIFESSRDEKALARVSAAVPRVRKRASEVGLDLDVLLPTQDDSFARVEGAPADQGLRCKLPWKILHVSGEGKAFLTGSCLRELGSYYDKSLLELWNSPVAQEYRRAMQVNAFRGLCREECVTRWEM